MAGQRELTEREVTGLSYLKKVRPLFARLKRNGCERGKAGNRELLRDPYCALVLLFLFHPIVDAGGSDVCRVPTTPHVRRGARVAENRCGNRSWVLLRTGWGLSPRRQPRVQSPIR